MRRLWRNNGLSIVLFALFASALFGQAVAGWRHDNDERRQHGREQMSLVGYVGSPGFLEATAENRESEFLQMAAYVWLTIVLFQTGSAESKDPEKESEEVDRHPDPTRPGAPEIVRRGGFALWFYRRSLLITFVVLFVASFLLHARGGARVYAEAQAEHGQPMQVSIWRYMRTSQFWFESLQNWQSEFLAVLSIVVLTIFLRQHGSPESKPVDASHKDTGIS